MTGKLFIGFLVTFCAGVVVGYFLPQNESAPDPETEIKLDSGEIADAEEDSDEIRAAEAAQKRVEERKEGGRPEKPERRLNNSGRRPARGEICTFIGFDAQGIESGQWPATAMGDGEFLIPAMALRAVVSAKVATARGSRSRVTHVKGLGDRGGLAIVRAALEAVAWPRRREAVGPRQQVWLLASARGTTTPQPASFGARRFDTQHRCEFVELKGRFDLPAGGIILDDNDRLLGLSLPTTESGENRVLETVAFLEERLRILEMKLEDYYRVYFAGSIEALLKEARHHLAGRRFLRAIEIFRIIADRGSEQRDLIHDEFLEAVNGHLGELPLETNARARLTFLRQVLRDFPGVGELWFATAQVARKLREYEESIRAYEGAWKANSDLVTDLVGSKNAVYYEWIMSHVDRDRVDDALQIIQIAVADTGGSSEIFLLQGKLLVRRRQYLAAADAMRDALQLDPSLGSSLDEAIARAERLAEGPGKVVIDYPPGSRAIIASVRLNGKASGDFIVDTGATTSMVPASLARRAGLDTSDRVPKVRLQTAGNERIVPYSPVQSISLGDLSVSNISVVVGDLSGKSGYGLLGMDFLGEFHIENDSQNGRMVISTRN